MLIDPLIDHVARCLSPSDSAFEQATGRAERIGRILQRDSGMEVADAEVGGSCGKQTAIQPLGDADLFVYLAPGSWVSTRGKLLTPATVLREFEDRVEHAYRTHIDGGRVRVRRQAHSLRLEPLGARSISVDVVPVRWDGNNQRIVLVPDRATRDWRLTCIRRQHELLDELDKPGRPVRRAIRLLKQWRTQHELPLRSYALEVLVLDAAFKGVPRHPRTLLLAVLEGIVATEMRVPVIVPRYATPKRIKRAAAHIYDPAVPDNNVADNIDGAGRARIVTRARRTLVAIDTIEEALDRGRTRAVERTFANVFGYEIALTD